MSEASSTLYFREHKYIIALNRDSGTIFKWGGGKGAAVRKLSTPNSNFSSDFGHFLLKMPMPNKKKTS